MNFKNEFIIVLTDKLRCAFTKFTSTQLVLLLIFNVNLILIMIVMISVAIQLSLQNISAEAAVGCCKPGLK